MEVGKNADKRKKALCFIWLLILLLTCCSFQALAAVQIATDANVSVSLQYTGKKGPVTGAEFHVYHVADIEEDGRFLVKEPFKDYPIPLDDMTQDQWQELAATLKGYVWKDQIRESDYGRTNQEGKLTFPSEGVSMKPGLYLILGDTRVIGSYTYYATPFFVCLPGLDANGGQNLYHMNVVLKYRWDYDRPDDPDPPSRDVTRKVLKVWEDQGNEAARPESITVHLLRNGQMYDTVKLHKGNNWRYTWNDLRRGYDWSVVEETIPGYTVNVSQEGITFLITNTYVPDSPEPDGGSDPPGDGVSVEHEGEGWLGVLGDMEEDFQMQILPQTGQLWWPVPVLVCLGLVCMMIGVIRRRSAYEEE